MADTDILFLSVVYVNYDQDNQLLASLESLFKYNAILQLGVVIVDNSLRPSVPTSDVASHLCQKYKARFAYLATSENIGFGKACNLGANQLQSTYTLFLNCDTQFIDSSLQDALAFMEQSDHTVAALGCIHLDRNNQPSFPAYPFVHDTLLNYFLLSNPLTFRFLRLNKLYSIPSGPVCVGDISGAFMLLRTDIFNRVGGFNPEFFLYSEDTSLCRDRIVSAGYHILLFPSARILHAVGTPQSYTWRAKQALASEMLRRYRQGPLVFFGFIIITLVNSAITLFLLVCKANRKSIFKQIKLARDLFVILLWELPVYLTTPSARDFRVSFRP